MAVAEAPTHDFPEVGSFIEICFANHKPVKAKVIRHSMLVINLDSGHNVPWHAVHWWKAAVPDDDYRKVTLELYEDEEECEGCPYFPYCRDHEIDGVFIGEDKKCEKNETQKENTL